LSEMKRGLRGAVALAVVVSAAVVGVERVDTVSSSPAAAAWPTGHAPADRVLRIREDLNEAVAKPRGVHAGAAAGSVGRSESPDSDLLHRAPSGSEPAGAAAYNPCPKDDIPLPDQGASLARQVTIPALPATSLPGPAAAFDPGPGEVPPTYDGTILRPADTRRYPGPRPAVVLMHGISGDQCQMWWLAQYLSGAGFVTMILTSPTPPEREASYGVAIDAARSAVSFLSTPPENPYAAVTSLNAMGLGGWSEGSVVASVAQGLPDMGLIKAIVAIDDLRGSFLGDSGAPLTFCSPPVRAGVTPRVPALGFASDTTCDVEPKNTSAGLKLSGFSRWRAENVPAVELPLAAYSHFDYDTHGAKLIQVGALTRAWFAAWLSAQPHALELFETCQTGSLPTPGTYSKTFVSAAYLPPLGIDSTSWGQDLAARCGWPATVVGSTPIS